MKKLQPQPSDEELMIAYQSGQEDAFQSLYDRHASRVYGFLSSKLKDRALADDAFQAAFLKLHQSRAKYDPAFPFVPWLFTVSRSAMLDTLRARKRVTLNEDLNPVEVENALAPPVMASASLPDLSELPAIQRQAIELRYVQDLSFDEIATRLETTSDNSRQLVSRAIKKLRELLREKGGEK